MVHRRFLLFQPVSAAETFGKFQTSTFTSLLLVQMSLRSVCRLKLELEDTIGWWGEVVGGSRGNRGLGAVSGIAKHAGAMLARPEVPTSTCSDTPTEARFPPRNKNWSQLCLRFCPQTPPKSNFRSVSGSAAIF